MNPYSFKSKTDLLALLGFEQFNYHVFFIFLRMTHKAIKNDFSFEILIKTFQDPLFKLFSNITITGFTGTTN